MSVAADQLTLGAALLVVVPVAFAANAAAAATREVGEDLGVLAQDVVHAPARADPLLRLLLRLRLERLRGSGVRLFAARGRLWRFRVLADPPLGALPPEAGVERASRILKRSFQINLHMLGFGGGLVVTILALYSDDTSLNPTGYLYFMCIQTK